MDRKTGLSVYIGTSSASCSPLFLSRVHDSWINRYNVPPFLLISKSPAEWNINNDYRCFPDIEKGNEKFEALSAIDLDAMPGPVRDSILRRFVPVIRGY